MNSEMSGEFARKMSALNSKLGIAIFGVVLLSTAHSFAQVTVSTIGGGPLKVGGPSYGYQDGDTLQQAQFHTPMGCTFDRDGNLFVADRDNGSVRKLDLTTGRTKTYIDGFSKPVAVGFDSANNLYVLDNAASFISKIDRFGFETSVGSGLTLPTAFWVNTNGLIYLTEFSGSLKRIENGITTTVFAGLRQPQGIAVLDNGWIAVSESANHTVRVIDPAAGQVKQVIGTAIAGKRDGPLSLAQFNSPHQLAKIPNGGLLVADRNNHCVRVIQPEGVVTTLYGLKPELWGYDNPTAYLGWWDGTDEYAEAREPVGIAYYNGSAYVTEVYYHIIRKAADARLSYTPGQSTNLVVYPPTITPNSGYFPMGQKISVTTSNQSVFFPVTIYYTTDGSEPSTNSYSLNLTNQTGIISWQEANKDLTSLKVKAYVGNVPSATVSGQKVSANEIGVHRDVLAGPGSSILVPVVINLYTNEVIRSLQFRAEVSPYAAGVTPINDNLESIEINPAKDCIPLISPGGSGVTSFNGTPYAITNQGVVTRGLWFASAGVRQDFSISSFGAVTLIKIPVPSQAKIGDQYRIIIKEISAADENNKDIRLVSMPECKITVATIPYYVGDVGSAAWYNAGDFGDSDLRNVDVNSIFYATMGERVPYTYSDLFNAMDAFPADGPVVGGDGRIRYLDWQTVLLRSLRFDQANYQRYWGADGERAFVAKELIRPMGVNPKPTSLAVVTNRDWYRQALIGAISLDKISAGSTVSVPIYINVAERCQLSGFQFRVTAVAENGAPQLLSPMSYNPAVNFPKPFKQEAVGNDNLLVIWSFLSNPLTGSNYLGTIQFQMPGSASYGQYYTLRFSYADGAPDLSTQYEFETIPAYIWAWSPAQKTQERVSDEWKQFFFGSLNNPLAQSDADPDGDGINNAAAFIMGINPVQVRLLTDTMHPSGTGFTLRWFAALGAQYWIESTTDPMGQSWSVIAIETGKGSIKDYVDKSPAITKRYYRVRAKMNP